MSTTIDTSLLHSAREEAEAAASRAGVDIRILDRPEQCAAASQLLEQIWGSDDPDADNDTIAEPGLLVALQHSGNYVSGAYPRRLVVTPDNADEIQGMAFGFFATPVGEHVHSHVAGVRRDRLGKGMGAALKLDQRAWCLEHGVTEMTWTFDPLVARNAYFNFQRLGGDCAEYLADFYGQMNDGVNAGQASDRMMVSWRLDQPVGRKPVEYDIYSPGFGWALSADTNTDEPVLTVSQVPETAHTVGVQIPLDVERLRVEDPELAVRWRMALREAMTALLDGGWQIIGVAREGMYVLQR